MSEAKWEIGMAVAVHPSYWRDETRKQRVASVTKTQITLDDGSRWVIRTGREVDSRAEYNYRKVEPWTQAHTDAATKRKAEVDALRARCIEALGAASEALVRHVAYEMRLKGGV